VGANDREIDSMMNELRGSIPHFEKSSKHAPAADLHEESMNLSKTNFTEKVPKTANERRGVR